MSNYERFRPTSLQAQKERKQEVANTTNEYENDDSGRIRRKTIKADGSYKIRMWPAHPVDGAISIEPKVVYWIPGWVNKKDENGKWIQSPDGKYLKELKNKPVFDARVHGKSQYDLVDTYISIAKKQAEALYPDSKESQKNYLAPVIGNRYQNGQYPGIMPTKSFLFYGEMITGSGDDEKLDFYEFEVGKAIEKGIYKQAAIEDDNEALGTDGCFTDPLDGRPLKIKVDSVAGKTDPANWYTVSIVTETEKVNIGGKIQSVIKSYPIAEEKLDWYDKEVEPLIKYREVFSNRDLQIQLEGLKIFDAEHKFNIIDTDDFKEVFEYLLNKFPKIEDDQNDEQQDNFPTSTLQNQDEFDLMDKNELKGFIKSNELGIIVLPRHTEEDLRDMIREVLNNQEDNIQEQETTQDDKEDTTEATQPEPPATTGNWRDRVKNLGSKVNS